MLSVKQGERVIEEVPDINPVSLDSDEEAVKLIDSLLEGEENWSDKEKKLLARCRAAAAAADGDEVEFGPIELLAISRTGHRHGAVEKQLMALAHYLLDQTEFEGELPPDAYLTAAEAYSGFSAAKFLPS
jgi:hypothetical protein